MDMEPIFQGDFPTYHDGSRSSHYYPTTYYHHTTQQDNRYPLWEEAIEPSNPTTTGNILTILEYLCWLTTTIHVGVVSESWSTGILALILFPTAWAFVVEHVMRFYTWLRPRIGRFCRAVPGWIAWPFRRVVGLAVRVVNRYLGLPGWILLFGTLVLGVFFQIAALYGNGWDSLGELMFDVLIPVLWPFLLLWDVFMGIVRPFQSGGIAMVQGTLTILFWSPVTIFGAVFWE